MIVNVLGDQLQTNIARYLPEGILRTSSSIISRLEHMQPPARGAGLRPCHDRRIGAVLRRSHRAQRIFVRIALTQSRMQWTAMRFVARRFGASTGAGTQGSFRRPY